LPLSLLIETRIRSIGPVNMLIGLLIGGFLLCLMSTWAGIGNLPLIEVVSGTSKNLGFWSSPNWYVTFLVLFPLFMLFFAFQVQQCDLIRENFADAMVITGPNGVRVATSDLNDEWQVYLARRSIILWALLAVVVLQTISDWWGSCGHALYYNKLGNETRDWSTAVLLAHRDDTTATHVYWGILAFSGFAYLYMGTALFLYLSAVIYSVSFALFLHGISTSTGDRRLVFKHRELCTNLETFFNNIYGAIFMGLCAALFMRLEVGYLTSSAKNMEEFLFQDIPIVSTLLKAGKFDFAFKEVPALSDFDN
jgi:hypothetical protein